MCHVSQPLTITNTHTPCCVSKTKTGKTKSRFRSWDLECKSLQRHMHGREVGWMTFQLCCAEQHSQLYLFSNQSTIKRQRARNFNELQMKQKFKSFLCTAQNWNRMQQSCTLNLRIRAAVTNTPCCICGLERGVLPLCPTPPCVIILIPLIPKTKQQQTNGSIHYTLGLCS